MWNPLTLKRLAEIDNIVGVKEASGNIGQMAAVVHQRAGEFRGAIGRRRDHHSADRAGRARRDLGCIERDSERDDPTDPACDGERLRRRARKLQRQYLPLMEVNFVESNPSPVKAAMAMMGLLEPVWRLPMVAPTAANQSRIEKVLAVLGLLAGRTVHAG